MFARRQLEHGLDLSHRTLRLRHTIQLRNFGADEPVLADVGEVAFFSELETEAATDAVAAAICDMIQSEFEAFNHHSASVGRTVTIEKDGTHIVVYLPNS